MNLMTPDLFEKINYYLKINKPQIFYWTKEWKELKKYVLDRDDHECQMCKAKGLFGNYGACHHIKELKDRPDLALDSDNIVTICKGCHNEAHPEKQFKNKVYHISKWE